MTKKKLKTTIAPLLPQPKPSASHRAALQAIADMLRFLADRITDLARQR